MTDLDLIRRLLEGDEGAFEEFFGEYFPRLFRFACARLGNEDLAQEAVQAALVRAVQKLGTYRGEAALFTWLCAICRREIARVASERHVAGTELREDRPEIRAALEELADVAGGNPEQEAQRSDLRRLVHATLDHLPSRYGEALEWRYIDGLSVSEVAQRLGLGYKAAESLLTRAREAFKDGFRTVVAGES
jgi:RNA polymerase sigma-70 factor (ECF subfamily)